MCLLWFSLCHRHCQEDEVEDGWLWGQLDRPSVPVVLLRGGRSRVCPAAPRPRAGPSRRTLSPRS